MGFMSAMVGGGMGLAAQLLANSIRKIPLSREPWMHVLLFTTGCWVGGKYPKWEKELVEDINELRSSRGLPPMVGSSYWIRYRAPEEDEEFRKY